MGPHSFKCGSKQRITNISGKKTSFNGAALFQVRKCQSARWSIGLQLLLQWGRTLSSAEVEPSHSPERDAGQASMGPHSFKCGSGTATPGERDQEAALQWGRTLSSAEVGIGASVFAEASKASMGPHSFKCGSRNRRLRVCGGVKGFNGAALFQVRKSDDYLFFLIG